MANSPIVGSDFSPISWTGDACEQFGKLFQTNERLNTFLTWLLGTDGALSNDVLDGIESRMLPVGTTIMYSSDVMPSDHWLPADGRSISRNLYQKLFSRMGTKYGAGDGPEEFNLPTSKDLFPVGAGGSLAIGQLGGSDEATISSEDLPPHYHGFGRFAGDPNNNNDAVFCVRTWSKSDNGTTRGFDVPGDGDNSGDTNPMVAGELGTTTEIFESGSTPISIQIIPKFISHLFIVKVK